jgi:hypothetical protein
MPFLLWFQTNASSPPPLILKKTNEYNVKTNATPINGQENERIYIPSSGFSTMMVIFYLELEEIKWVNI